MSGGVSEAKKEGADVRELIVGLLDSGSREVALTELSKRREEWADLAPMLWFSPATVAVLLSEVVAVYPFLVPSALSPAQSNRVCNSLALLQVIASHPDTRDAFLKAHIPLYLYPFLSTMEPSKPFVFLRLTALGVIGALVKSEEPEVIAFLLKTEIVPLCLRIMESSQSELSKTVACFVIQKALQDAVGLSYACASPERFYAIANVLASMCSAMQDTPSLRLLKHIVRCYRSLANNGPAREALRAAIPDVLRSGTLVDLLRTDAVAFQWLQETLERAPPVEE